MARRKRREADSRQWLLSIIRRITRQECMCGHLGFRHNLIPEERLAGVIKHERHLTLLTGKDLAESFSALHASDERRRSRAHIMLRFRIVGFLLPRNRRMCKKLMPRFWRND